MDPRRDFDTADCDCLAAARRPLSKLPTPMVTSLSMLAQSARPSNAWVAAAKAINLSYRHRDRYQITAFLILVIEFKFLNSNPNDPPSLYALLRISNEADLLERQRYANITLGA